jgi:hypothetical protein
VSAFLPPLKSTKENLMKRSYLYTLLVIFGLWGAIATFLLVSQQSDNVSTNNTQEMTAETNIFPSCSPDMALKLGPKWRNIVVGETHIMEIEQLYGVSFSRVEFPYDPSTNRFFVNLTMDAANERELARYAEVCVVNTRIALLHLSVDSDAELPPSFLSAWVRLYGIPDLVTWGTTGNDWQLRTIAWPKAGIILHVDAGPTINDPRVALVKSVTLAPFSTNDNFLSEWPYSNLPTEPPTSASNGLPTEQNPFDFDAMLATQEAQS